MMRSTMSLTSTMLNGIADALDEGCVALKTKTSAKSFVASLGKLRIWERELGVDLDAD